MQVSARRETDNWVSKNRGRSENREPSLRGTSQDTIERELIKPGIERQFSSLSFFPAFQNRDDRISLRRNVVEICPISLIEPLSRIGNPSKF